MKCIEISLDGIQAGIWFQTMMMVKSGAKRLIDERGNSFLPIDQCSNSDVIPIGEGPELLILKIGNENLKPEMVEGRIIEAHPNEKTKTLDRSPNPNTPWFLVRIRTGELCGEERGFRAEGWVRIEGGKAEILAERPINRAASDYLVKMHRDAVLMIKMSGTTKVMEFSPREVEDTHFAKATDAQPPAPNGEEERPTLQ